MAEILLKIVLNKLSDVVLQEIFFLCGVKEKVEHVKIELTRIQCFLRDADRKHGEDARVQNWVNELRDVSHWIEDTVDLFVIEVEESTGEHSGAKKMSMKEKVTTWLKKPVRLHKFGEKLDKILARIGEIAASRGKYGIINLGEGGGSGVTAPFKRLIIPDLDETELIGVNAEKEKVVAQLLDENQLRRSVVSIVRPGGLGKSTVAAKAYSSNEVKSKFEVRVWLSISQSFTPINLLKKMIKVITKAPEESKCDDQVDLMTTVNESLRKKKYLIVLDDVWSNKLWPEIDQALPDVKNGSRVLITSRVSTVPRVADPGSEPHELRYLNPEESLQLLLKTALRNRDGIESFATDISDVAKQLAHICDGLPLALVTVGGLLSTKPLTYHAWENVSKTMVWGVHGKTCMNILTTSYDDMPIELKLCFMYLACYPEDHIIHADELIRLWIAEGLILDIPGRPDVILEDIAEEYLEQLAQRSMVQVLEIHPWDSIKTCRLHDLMRDVAIQKAKEDNFLTVCSNKNVEESCGRARRVAAVHYDHCDVMKHVSSNLRSFLCFNKQTQIIYGRKLLRVLHFGYDNSAKVRVEFERIGSSTQLRYLRFGGFLNIKYKRRFSKFIEDQKNLQTFFCSEFMHRNMLEADCMWHVKTLRHFINNTPFAQYQWGPPPSVDLSNLQTLVGVIVPKSWEITALPNLPNLRKLKIEKDEGSSWEVVVAFLLTLKNLQHLIIKGGEFPIEVVDMRDFPFYRILKSLEFRNCSHRYRYASLRYKLDAAMFPPHLTMLTLYNIGINQDVMLLLEKLQGLKVLFLLIEDASSDPLRCTARGFPQLDDLKFNLDSNNSSNSPREWEIEEGAMPRLKSLTIDHCYFNWRHVTGHEHLTALRNVRQRVIF